MALNRAFFMFWTMRDMAVRLQLHGWHAWGCCKLGGGEGIGCNGYNYIYSCEKCYEIKTVWLNLREVNSIDSFIRHNLIFLSTFLHGLFFYCIQVCRHTRLCITTNYGFLNTINILFFLVQVMRPPLVLITQGKCNSVVRLYFAFFHLPLWCADWVFMVPKYENICLSVSLKRNWKMKNYCKKILLGRDLNFRLPGC